MIGNFTFALSVLYADRIYNVLVFCVCLFIIWLDVQKLMLGSLVAYTDGLKWVRENPEASYAGAICATIVLFSGIAYTRGFVCPTTDHHCINKLGVGVKI